MFENDYFQDVKPAGPGKSGQVVGGVGMWGLHLAAVAFALYSGYHGISATARYRAGSGLGMMAGIVGIVVIEVVFLSVYMAWHNSRITGALQSIAACVTASIGFVLACLGIVADSQLQAGYALSGWLSGYLMWGLPIAPAIMALGALLTHELAPGQLRARRENNERDEMDELRFSAHIATMRAELEAARTVANMQLNARASAARQIGAWYGSDAAQKAITATALQNAPGLLRSIGVDVDAAESVPGPGSDMDLEELVNYLVEERLQARIPAPAAVSENGHGHPARPTQRPGGR